jgi:hypothetical protein
MLRCAIHNLHDKSTAQDGPIVDRPALKAAEKTFNFRFGDAFQKDASPICPLYDPSTPDYAGRGVQPKNRPCADPVRPSMLLD